MSRVRGVLGSKVQDMHCNQKGLCSYIVYTWVPKVSTCEALGNLSAKLKNVTTWMLWVTCVDICAQARP